MLYDNPEGKFYEHYLDTNFFDYNCQTQINASYLKIIQLDGTDIKYLEASLHSPSKTIHTTKQILFRVNYFSTKTKKSEDFFLTAGVSFGGSHRQYLPRMQILLPLTNVDLSKKVQVWSHSYLSCGGAESKPFVIPSAMKNDISIVNFEGKIGEYQCKYLNITNKYEPEKKLAETNVATTQEANASELSGENATTPPNTAGVSKFTILTLIMIFLLPFVAIFVCIFLVMLLWKRLRYVPGVRDSIKETFWCFSDTRQKNTDGRQDAAIHMQQIDNEQLRNCDGESNSGSDQTLPNNDPSHRYESINQSDSQSNRNYPGIILTSESQTPNNSRTNDVIATSMLAIDGEQRESHVDGGSASTDHRFTPPNHIDLQQNGATASTCVRPMSHTPGMLECFTFFNSHCHPLNG